MSSSHPLLKNVFAGYRILDTQGFLIFQNFKVLFHFLLASIVSDEKSLMFLSWFPCVQSFFPLFWLLTGLSIFVFSSWLWCVLLWFSLYLSWLGFAELLRFIHKLVFIEFGKFYCLYFFKYFFCPDRSRVKNPVPAANESSNVVCPLEKKELHVEYSFS